MDSGATRAERIKDALDVLQADYTKAVVKRRVVCHECGGEPLEVKDTEEESDKVRVCGLCNGDGFVMADEYDFAAIPARLRKFVTGFKSGPRGMLIPDMRSKDKAADALIKMIGSGWTVDFPRDAYGADAPGDDGLSKEALIGMYAQVARESADAITRMNALKEIAKLKGYLTEDDKTTDNTALAITDIQGFFNAILNSKGHNLPPATSVDGSGDYPERDGAFGSADDPTPDDEGLGEG